MNPENTHIVIRKRNVGEILNLAYLLIVRYFSPMLWAGILMVPFCLLPWGIYYAASVMWPEGLSMLYEEFGTEDMLFLYAVGVFIFAFFLESLVTAPLTLLMGQIVFGGEADWRKIRREYLESLPQLLYYTVLWRITTFRWAFCSEIILLERNAWGGSAKAGKRTTTQRCKDIYWRDYESIYRFFAAFTWMFLVGVSTFFGVMTLRWIIVGSWDDAEIPAVMGLFYLPWILCAAEFYYCVVRFLGYLDFRIRSEGWDVDLQIREECARMDRGRVTEEEEW